MFSDLNPLDTSTAILEIVIMLVGAFLIGLICAAIFFRKRAAKEEDSPEEELPEGKVGRISRKEFIRLKKAENDWRREKMAWETKETQWKQQLKDAQRDKIAAEGRKIAGVSLDDAELKFEALEKELSVTKKQIEQLENEKKALTAESKSHSEKLAALKSQTDAGKDNSHSELASLQKKLSKAVEEGESKQKALTLQLAAAQKSITDKVEKLSQSENALSEKVQEIKRLETRLSDLEKASESAKKGQKAEQEKASAAKDAEVETLRQRLKELEDKMAGNAASQSQASEALAGLRAKLKSAEGEALALKKQVEDLQNEQAEEAQKPVEDTLNTRIIHKLTAERDALQKQLDAMKAQSTDAKSSAAQPVEEQKPTPQKVVDILITDDEPEEGQLENKPEAPQKTIAEAKPEADAQPAVPTLDSLLTAAKGHRDNLTKISGIKPATQDALHRAGVFTFAQMAALSEEDREKLDVYLGLPKGSIKKQKWVKQAKKRL